MNLELLPQKFSVCQIENISATPMRSEFCFIGKTDQELSLVCPTEDVPVGTIAREDGWRGLRIAGTLEFSLVGILSKLSGILAEAQVGIFAISTYDTDYILLKEVQLDQGLSALSGHGYVIEALPYRG